MAWEDRSYYRDQSSSRSNAIMRIVNGSVPLFTIFGVRVRAHASLVFFIAVTILLDWQDGYPLQLRATTMAIMFGIVTLHELGHCFMARWVGGTADEALLWPLGGLAMTNPPHRPLPTFLTVAAGPATNALICLICAGGLWFTTPTHHWWGMLNPLHPLRFFAPGAGTAAVYLWWIYYFSYVQFLFNVLLPIFPLDGGQMVQTALWAKLGYHRSMVISTSIGMAGSLVMFIVGLFIAPLFISLLAVWLFLGCLQQRMMLREMGESGEGDWSESSGVDYNASLHLREDAPRRRRANLRALRRARKIARMEADQAQQIDTILAKVSAKGMASLSWREKRALRKATEQQRRREVELSEYQ